MDDEKHRGKSSGEFADVPMRRLPTGLHQTAMAHLWARMSALYGAGRWLGHAPQNEHCDSMGQWADILGGQTMTGIARALDRFAAEPGKHPPGAGEFRRACAEYQPGTFAGAASQAGQRLKLADSAENIAKWCLDGRAKIANMRKAAGV